MLREYQSRAIAQLYDWLATNDGHPCLVLPTGSGKSHIVAALCKDALQNWPETRILMLTHQKELIEQNAEKMRLHWRGAPMGIWSASVGKRQIGEPITFAGIQTVRGKAAMLGHVDLAIIDESHLVNHREEGAYRTLLAELMQINPALRIVGLTATPYRLGHGLITDKPALFSALLEPVTIEELVYKGYLAPLRSKLTQVKLSTEGVHKRGGEFIEAQLQAAVNTELYNEGVVAEVIRRAEDRKAWLFFCAGVAHAENIAAILREHGIAAACVTGATTKSEREQLLTAFKEGRLRALTNANVLTTGFDYPDIDLIALVRPTMSASLYVQMAGRGMRPKSHTDHCLVLDFAGVVEMHGPITAVRPSRKAGSGEGDAPAKVCEGCGELVHISAQVCPACGFEFPKPEPKPWKLRDDDIMGIAGLTLEVESWRWSRQISKSKGIEMLRVNYYGKGLAGATVPEFFTIRHDGWAGQKSISNLAIIATNAAVPEAVQLTDLEEIADALNKGRPPAEVDYKMEGKYPRVLSRRWDHE